MVVLLPEPLIVPGLIVQFPAGRLLSTTLPVEVEQVGWVIVPTCGAARFELMVAVTAVLAEVQVPLVTST